MKRLCVRLVFSLVILFSAAQLAAQNALCDKCMGGDIAYCDEVEDGETGRAGCTGGWTDLHNGMTSNPHCHFSGGWCERYEPPDPIDPPGQLEDCQSPILIGKTGGRYELSDESDPVLFDLLGYGQPGLVTWTARGSGLAFLALDRNLNGRIDNGYELFGNYAPHPEDRSKTNGFAWLTNYDAEPQNGMIDEFDPIWPYLLLWEDVNHDGISQPGELSRLADSDITALGLDYKTTGRRDPAGSLLRYKAQLWRGGHTAPYYDVYFKMIAD